MVPFTLRLLSRPSVLGPRTVGSRLTLVSVPGWGPLRVPCLQSHPGRQSTTQTVPRGFGIVFKVSHSSVTLSSVRLSIKSSVIPAEHLLCRGGVWMYEGRLEKPLQSFLGPVSLLEPQSWVIYSDLGLHCREVEFRSRGATEQRFYSNCRGHKPTEGFSFGVLVTYTSLNGTVLKTGGRLPVKVEGPLDINIIWS